MTTYWYMYVTAGPEAEGYRDPRIVRERDRDRDGSRRLDERGAAPHRHGQSLRHRPNHRRLPDGV